MEINQDRNIIINNLIKLLKNDSGAIQFKKYFESININPNDQAILFKEAKELFESRKRKKRKIIYFIIFVLAIIFSTLIPLSIAVKSTKLIYFFGTVFTVFSLFQIIFDFRSYSDFELKMKSKFLELFFIFFTVVITITIFVGYKTLHDYKLDLELNENGIETEGKIINREVSKIKNNSTYSVTFEFLDQSGLGRTITLDVTENQYIRSQIGRKVKVKYSSTNPNLAKILFEESEELLNSDLREMNIWELIEFVDLNDSQVSEELSKIHYSWQYDSINKIWNNSDTYEKIKKKDQQMIIYNKDSNIEFENNLIANGYNKTINNPTTSTFLSERYTITIINDKESRVIIYKN
jgi:heme/copper-type cytochrome/quinol oxidase subunit 4